MKLLAVFALAFALTLCPNGVVAAPASAGSAVSQGPTRESAESSLTLFYKPGRTKTQIDVSVNESVITRIQPGETIKLLPSSGPLTVHLAALPLRGKGSGPTLAWQTEIEESKSKHVVVQMSNTGISLLEQRRYVRARPFDKTFALDGEDNSWVNVSPPPPNSLRRNDKAPRHTIQWSSPKSWPVRVLFIPGHALYEFDKKGNVTRMDGRQPSSPLSIKQERHGNKPAWSNGDVFHLVSGNAVFDDKVESARTFVRTRGGRVCPAMAIAEAYRRLRGLPSPIFSGACDQAIQWRQSGTPLWAYQSDANSGEPPELLWSVQYFRDPVRPLADFEGKCVYGCSAEIIRSDHPANQQQ
ncbi:hypothetical protein J5T34_08465 [Cupriavidus gilardii]|uniref:hypothetical protein n=1 Tax=Cupriavidus gilardii TaxID=82541 RepID=UPI001ABECFBA|nr:hypothetical protein [Cupriavidus gilardii]MBO4120771.1 hypothetical protein [Cupriavidus gilardii]